MVEFEETAFLLITIAVMGGTEVFSKLLIKNFTPLIMIVSL